MALTQTYGLDDAAIIDPNVRRVATFKNNTAGSVSLTGDVTSSGGAGTSLDLKIDGTTQVTYGLIFGVYTGFTQPNTSGTLFFGIGDAANYILIAGSGLGGGVVMAASGAITIAGPSCAISNTVTVGSLVDSALTSGRVVFAGASGLLSDDADMTFATDTFTVTKSQVKAGTSSSNAKVGGVLSASTTAVGNVGVGEDDLITYSVPANTLATNLDYIEFDMFFTFAANANTKRVKIKYGATTLFDTTALILNGVDGRAQGIIIRTGATTQKAICTFTTSTALLTQLTDYATPGETLSGAVTLKATGEATSNNDVSQEVLIVKSYTG